MKKLLTLLLLVPALALAQAPKQKPGVVYDWKINRVVDGDTVEISTPWTPDPLPKKMSVRVFGVDTPEKAFVLNVQAKMLVDRLLLHLLKRSSPKAVLPKL